MTPDLRSLIYTTIVSVLAAMVLGIGKIVRDAIVNRRRAPVDQGQAITNLADTMVRVSTQAVDGIRAELSATQSDLTRANARIRELEVMVATVERLTRRVALLERLLQVNRIEVPPDDSH